MCEGRVAEQLGALGTQLHRLGDELAIVVGVGVVAARDPGLEDFLAQIALFGKLQYWFDARAGGRDCIGRIEAAILGRFGRSFAGEFGNAGQVALLKRQHKRLLIGQDILPENRAQCRQFLDDRSETIAGRTFKLGSGPHEIEMIALKHPQAFVVEFQGRGLALKRVDALEEPGVEIDVVPVLRENRRYVAFDFLDRVIGVRRGKIVEHGFDLAEQPSAVFQCQNRVLESRRRGVLRDRCNLRCMLRQRAVVGGTEMLGLDAIERRCGERCGPVFEEGI